MRQYTLEKRNKQSCEKSVNHKGKRPTQPVRRFKVPGWSDNYYSNLLDWSYTNFICAANHNELYFYNMAM